MLQGHIMSYSPPVIPNLTLTILGVALVPEQTGRSGGVLPGAFQSPGEETRGQFFLTENIKDQLKSEA